MLPVIAQGGNQALESVAAMTNSLLAVLLQPAAGRMSTDEIRGMFEEVQELRAKRVTKIVDMGRQRQQMDAMETPELEEFMLNKFPLLLPRVLIDRWDQTFSPSVSLRLPAAPPRPKQVLFEDEMEPSQDTANGDTRL